MHPAIEDPHAHEAAVAVRPRRRRGQLVPLRLPHRRQRLATLGRRGAEAPQQVRRGKAAQRPHPPLVQHADVVATCLSVDTSMSASGVPAPCSIDSVPITCATTSCTVLPAARRLVPRIIRQVVHDPVDRVPAAEESAQHDVVAHVIGTESVCRAQALPTQTSMCRRLSTCATTSAC